MIQYEISDDLKLVEFFLHGARVGLVELDEKYDALAFEVSEEAPEELAEWLHTAGMGLLKEPMFSSANDSFRRMTMEEIFRNAEMFTSVPDVAYGWHWSGERVVVCKLDAIGAPAEKYAFITLGQTVFKTTVPRSLAEVMYLKVVPALMGLHSDQVVDVDRAMLRLGVRKISEMAGHYDSDKYGSLVTDARRCLQALREGDMREATLADKAMRARWSAAEILCAMEYARQFLG